MNKSEYSAYMASREWALLKEQVRKRSQGYCERCAVEPHEQTHHLTYERVGSEKLDDLLGVCSGCHEYLSGKTDRDPAWHTSAFVCYVKEADIRGVIPRLYRQMGIRIVGKPLAIHFVKEWISRFPKQAAPTIDIHDVLYPQLTREPEER